MNKDAQSLLDFINFLPLQGINVARAPISNREAQALYDIWKKGERESDGSIVVDDNIDPLVVASLLTKGMVKSQPTKRAKEVGRYYSVPVRTLAITDRGRSIVKSIILFTEKSKFEERKNGIIDYESIHRALYDPAPPKTASKVASRINQPVNWLQRAAWKSQ